jgi:hypothetical protein
MKKHNPETPILIREATGVAPKVWARYSESRFTIEPMVKKVGLTWWLAMGRERSEELAGEFGQPCAIRKTRTRLTIHARTE